MDGRKIVFENFSFQSLNIYRKLREKLIKILFNFLYIMKLSPQSA